MKWWVGKGQYFNNKSFGRLQKNFSPVKKICNEELYIEMCTSGRLKAIIVTLGIFLTIQTVKTTRNLQVNV